MPTLDIKILGPGCQNCKRLDALVRDVVGELGLDASIGKVEDYAEIASYGVMGTPGLVIDDAVVSTGRVPSRDQVRTLIASAATGTG